MIICALNVLSNGAVIDAGADLGGSSASAAHLLLDLEFDGPVQPEAVEALDYLLGAAVTRFGAWRKEELESTEALRFFRSVDQALIEAGVIYPPYGQIDLLRNALKPRTLSAGDLTSAAMSPFNLRRQSWIRANHLGGGRFYFFDCDVAAVLYLAAAEKLGLPVVVVELPGHNFVRWASKGVRLNWDPNEGSSIEDTTYAGRWKVTPQLHDLFGYLEPMSRERIQTYWLGVVGQWRCRKGDFAGGLRDFRRAVEISPDDLHAVNELAWLLATAPDKALRSSSEACLLAEKLIARARRPNWLDTLAAAVAEAGDFERAVRLEEEAKSALERSPGQLALNEMVPAFDACLEAYRRKQSYAQAVSEGRIRSTTSPAQVND